MPEKISPAQFLTNCLKAEMNDPSVELKPARHAEHAAYKKLNCMWVMENELWLWHPGGRLTPSEYGNALLR